VITVDLDAWQVQWLRKYDASLYPGTLALCVSVCFFLGVRSIRRNSDYDSGWIVKIQCPLCKEPRPYRPQAPFIRGTTRIAASRP